MYKTTKPYTKEVLSLIKDTWETPFVKVSDGIYPTIEYDDYIDIDHTDGVGTKGYYHWQAGTYEECFEDAFAMNVNDLLMAGATPFKMQMHVTMQKDNHDAVLRIVKAAVKRCKHYEMAITGGETSIHWNLRGMDVSITMTGRVLNDREMKINEGDVVCAIFSDGLHSNGFSYVRKAFGKDAFLKDFVWPTRTYYEDLTHDWGQGAWRDKATGMMHITGGAFSKLHRILPNNLDIHLDERMPKPQAIFHMLKENLRFKDTQMYMTFNCGTGFIFTIPKELADKAVDDMPWVSVAGEVTKGTGKVHLKSHFTGETITV